MNKIKYTIIFIATISCINLFSQTPKVWQWIEQIGGSDWDITNGIVSDSKNNIYVAGGFMDTLFCGKKKVVSNGNRDIYVARFSNKGKVNWLWSVGGTSMDKITALCNSPEGTGLLIAGIAKGTFNIGDSNLDGSRNKLFLAQLSKKGKATLISTLPYSRKASGYKLISSNDAIYLAGTFRDSLQCEDKIIISQGYNDIFIAKYSQLGELIDLQAIGGKGDERLSAIAIDSIGQIILSVNFNREFQIENTLISPYAEEIDINKNSCLIKLNNTYSCLWTQSCYSSSYVSIDDIILDKNGNFLFDLNYSNTLTWDTIGIKSKGLGDFIIGKMTTMGEMIWLNNYGGKYNDKATTLLLNNAGGVMLCGRFNGKLSLDTFNLPIDSLSKNSIFLSVLSSSGEVVWVSSLQGDGNMVGKYMALDTDGNLYFTGSFTQKMETPSKTLLSKGDEDIFLASYCNCPKQSDLISGQKYIYPGEIITLTVPYRFDQVIWNGTVASQSIDITQSGEYSVAMIDNKGCIIHDTLVVVQASSFYFDLGNDTTLGIGKDLMLYGPENAVSYYWQDGSTDKDYAISSITSSLQELYYLCATDTWGTEYCDSIKIDFVEENQSSTNIEDASIIQIYPNPVDNFIKWHVTSKEWIDFDILLCNNVGIVYYKKEIKNYCTNTTKTINTSNLTTGSYVLKIVAKNGGSSQTVVIKM